MYKKEIKQTKTNQYDKDTPAADPKRERERERERSDAALSQEFKRVCSSGVSRTELFLRAPTKNPENYA